jgi:hypothetical protein
MTIVTKTRALRRMQQTPVILNGLLRNVSQETALACTDGPNGWSVLEVMCHLYDFEEIYTGRVRRALAEDTPAFDPIDQNALVQTNRYREQNLRDRFNGYLERRRAFLDLLTSLTDEQWRRTGIHSSFGELTITEIALNTPLHDVDHIEQITRALGLSETIY